MNKATAVWAGPLLVLGLAACEPMADANGTTAGQRITVPESVALIAASHQDLTSARLRPDDGCYWYTHRGPVETTELPLRTANGNPICTRPAE